MKEAIKKRFDEICASINGVGVSYVCLYEPTGKKAIMYNKSPKEIEKKLAQIEKYLLANLREQGTYTLAAKYNSQTGKEDRYEIIIGKPTEYRSPDPASPVVIHAADRGNTVDLTEYLKVLQENATYRGRIAELEMKVAYLEDIIEQIDEGEKIDGNEEEPNAQISALVQMATPHLNRYLPELLGGLVKMLNGNGRMLSDGGNQVQQQNQQLRDYVKYCRDLMKAGDYENARSYIEQLKSAAPDVAELLFLEYQQMKSNAGDR